MTGRMYSTLTKLVVTCIWPTASKIIVLEQTRTIIICHRLQNGYALAPPIKCLCPGANCTKSHKLPYRSANTATVP